MVYEIEIEKTYPLYFIYIDALTYDTVRVVL